mgnify:CR=1 FL=1
MKVRHGRFIRSRWGKVPGVLQRWCSICVHEAMFLLAALAFVWGGVFASDPWFQETLPGVLKVVDCPSDLDFSHPSRVVLQIIQNTFYKWYEFDIGPSGEFCIVLLEPEARRLTAEEARALLDASSRWVEQRPSSFEGYWTSPDDPVLAAPPVHLDVTFGANGGLSDESAPHVGTAPVRTEAGPWPNPQGTMSSVTVPQGVVGPDDRIRVTNTTSYPWYTIGFCKVMFRDGIASRGTGFLVSPYTVLTNAHMVYNHSRGGWAWSFLFAPGQYQQYQGGYVYHPFGYRYARILWTNTAWIAAGPFDSTHGYQYDANKHGAYDYAAAMLDRPFDGITTFMPIVLDYRPTYIHLAGYPAKVGEERDTYAMWYSHGPVHRVEPLVLYHLADATSGNSGGPIWVYDQLSERLWVVGLNAFGPDEGGPNGGPRFVQQNEQLIEWWMTWTPWRHAVYPPLTPQGPTSAWVGDTLIYSTGGSFCDNPNHTVEYRFDWGDGTRSAWSTSPSATKTWTAPGTYQVRAQARCAVDTSVESSWSPALTVVVKPRDGAPSTYTYGARVGWYLVSVPTTGDTAGIFGVNLYWWNGVRYDTFSGTSTIEPVKGYWAKLPANKTVTVTGSVPTTDQTVTLVRGWNMISVPWPYAKAAIQVIKGTEKKNWADAVAAGWVSDVIWSYDGVYSSATTLDPWYGYWLRALVDGLTLRFAYASRLATTGASCLGVKGAVPEGEELPPPPPSVSVAGFEFVNVPNPVKGVHTTTFKVRGPMASWVTEIKVQVFDLTGRLLWEGTAAGAELTWHTDDLTGAYLANGVYLYKVYVKVDETWISSDILKLVIQR